MSEQCEKDSKAHVEEIKEVSEVSNTYPVPWQIYGHDHFSKWPYTSFAIGAAALPVLINFTTNFTG